VSVDPFGANVGDMSAYVAVVFCAMVSVDPFGANVGDRRIIRHDRDERLMCQLIRSAPTSVTIREH